MIRVLLAICIAFAPHAAFAIPPTHCGVGRQSIVQHHQVQAVQAYVQYGNAVQLQQVYPYAYYSVGAAIQEEAIAERIAKAVQKKLQAVAPPAPAPAPEHPGAIIAAQRCSGCHKSGVKAVTDNGAPVLFDASARWAGTRDASLKAISATKLGAMPPSPGKPLNDDDFVTFRTYLESIYKDSK